MTAIRPPEFAPRLPYAALLLRAGRFVLADTFPFSRQGGHNRARIRTAQGAPWLTVPRRHAGLGVPLVEVETVEDGWRERHRKSLRAAYGMAPFFEHVAPTWDAVLDTPGSLADLAAASVAWAARWLEAPAAIVRASAIPGAPGSLAAVAEAVGAASLLTLPESAERDRASVTVPVHVLRFEEAERRQAFPGFVAGLSALDLVMNHGPASGDVLRKGIVAVEG